MWTRESRLVGMPALGPIAAHTHPRDRMGVCEKILAAVVCVAVP